MTNSNSLKKQFDLKGLHYQEDDLQHIESMLNYIYESKKALDKFPELKDKVSYTTVDKGVIKDD